MAVSGGYLAYVLEQLAGLGRVRSQRMFGGAGLYCDEIFFGLIADDTLYLRVDERNRGDYTARGMRQFRPYADQPQLSMGYYEVPVEVLEDVEQLAIWGRRSLTAAEARGSRRSDLSQPRKKVRGRSPNCGGSHPGGNRG